MSYTETEPHVLKRWSYVILNIFQQKNAEYDYWVPPTHFIVVGNNISSLRRKFYCYSTKNYFQRYYVSNYGKHFGRDSSEEISGQRIQSTHIML